MKAQHQIKFKRRRPRHPRPSKSKKQADLTPSHAVDITTGQVIVGERQLHFARALSDTEKSVRESSLVSLRVWLQEHGTLLGPGEMDRLWKALFYCVWMADKRPVITATIAAVVGLVDVVGWSFLEGGIRCMVREWSGVDRHRVDKFYELVNAMLDKGTERVCGSGEDAVFVRDAELWLALLRETVWKQLPRKGLGVALHILDVYVERVMRSVLGRAAKLSGNQVHKVFDGLMEDLYGNMGRSDGHALAIGKRARERVFDMLVGLVGEEEVGLKLKDRRDMIRRTAKRVFAIASAKETPDELRKGLYELRVDLKVFVDTCDGGNGVQEDVTMEVGKEKRTEDSAGIDIVEDKGGCENDTAMKEGEDEEAEKHVGSEKTVEGEQPKDKTTSKDVTSQTQMEDGEEGQ